MEDFTGDLMGGIMSSIWPHAAEYIQSELLGCITSSISGSFDFRLGSLLQLKIKNQNFLVIRLAVLAASWKLTYCMKISVASFSPRCDTPFLGLSA